MSARKGYSGGVYGAGECQAGGGPVDDNVDDGRLKPLMSPPQKGPVRWGGGLPPRSQSRDIPFIIGLFLALRSAMSCAVPPPSRGLFWSRPPTYISPYPPLAQRELRPHSFYFMKHVIKLH